MRTFFLPAEWFLGVFFVLFLPPSCCRHAGLRYFLFYPARREKHITKKPLGKSKVHDLIFIALDADACTAARWIMEEAVRDGGGGGGGGEGKKTTPLRPDVLSLTSGGKVVVRRHH